MNQNALHKLTNGLYIITSSHNGINAGCVANTLQQVTSSPMQLSITLNKENYTEEIIAQAGMFSGVVLTQETDMETIKTFGFHSSRDYDKFSGKMASDGQGILYPDDHMAARFTCKVAAQLDLGTHVMFIGEVIEAEVLGDEEVMTYAYYHKVKNGATPKNAPSYQEAPAVSGWRCPICGYIYEGDPLPEDFVCPLCGAPAAVFEKI